MGDFKLKSSVDVKYDKVNDVYVFGHFDETKMKKVTSRAFSCLLGKNFFTSVGQTILERFKLIESQDIDKYWGVRGDMAELLVAEFLTESYKQNGVELKLKTWTKEEVNYDNFSRNEKFGGLLDIAISQPEKYRAVVEVKSKSMKDVEKITKSCGNIEEVLQGKFLTYLSNVSKCLMVYVFFTKDQEQEIKNYVKENDQKYPGMNFAKMLIAKMDMDYTSVKILVFKHNLDIPREKDKEGNIGFVVPNDFKSDMTETHGILMDFKQTKSIPSSFFGVNEILYLKELTGQDDSIF